MIDSFLRDWLWSKLVGSICSCYPYDYLFAWVRVGENANTISILLVSICLVN